jgi:predicted glycosyltransferase
MSRGPVWFDFENTPHVLFLEPVIRRLQALGIETVVTAKPQSQTVQLAEARGLQFAVVGDGNHKGRIRKLLGGLGRASQLVAWVLSRRRPSLLVSSSRTACTAARSLGIPAVGILDYEHSEYRPIAMASRPVLMPDLFRRAQLPPALNRAVDYFEGLKENLYLDGCDLDRDSNREMLGVENGAYVVVGRPPAWNAHYAVRAWEGAALWVRVLRDFAARDHVRIHVAPRDNEQREWLSEVFASTPRVHVISTVVDGPSLVAASDLVVSGGGTMNREAAVLGVPAWSVFTGPPPFVDECLAQEGRLRWVRTAEEYEVARAASTSGPLPRRGPFPAGLARIVWLASGSEESRLSYEQPAVPQLCD